MPAVMAKGDGAALGRSPDRRRSRRPVPEFPVMMPPDWSSVPVLTINIALPTIGFLVDAVCETLRSWHNRRLCRALARRRSPRATAPFHAATLLSSRPLLGHRRQHRPVPTHQSITCSCGWARRAEAVSLFSLVNLHGTVRLHAF